MTFKIPGNVMSGHIEQMIFSNQYCSKGSHHQKQKKDRPPHTHYKPPIWGGLGGFL